VKVNSATSITTSTSAVPRHADRIQRSRMSTKVLPAPHANRDTRTSRPTPIGALRLARRLP